MTAPRTSFTLSQAAKQTGKSKSVISKALKDGKLSYASKDSAGYSIDAAELFRVFPHVTEENGQEPRSETAKRTSENEGKNPLETQLLEGENLLLKERMRDKERRIDELQDERDEWRSQAQRLLLTHQPAPNPTLTIPSSSTSLERQFWTTIGIGFFVIMIMVVLALTFGYVKIR